MSWFRSLFSVPVSAPTDQVRWVVIDCESTGLDPQSDRLLSIGAVAVEFGRIAVGSTFSVILRQEAPSCAENIAIHGISGGQQITGIDWNDALRQFLEFAGDAPLVAFHAPFDRALLLRAAKSVGLRIRNPWLDAAALAPILFPERAGRLKALDDWIVSFGIENPSRHDALSDAYATAQLFQVLISAARLQGFRDARALISAARQGRWVKS